MILLIAINGRAQPADTVKAEEKEAMEIGGFVTVDFGGETGRLKQAAFNMGTVELGANVNIKENLKASITLLSENDMSLIGVDQAMATVDLPGCKTYFGLHVFNHGLLSTHLISDPLILDRVELSAPGGTVTCSVNKSTFGLGMTILRVDTISSQYTAVANWDYAVKEESVLRLSALVSNKTTDADLALIMPVGPVSLDGEVYTQLTVQEGGTRASGYMAGIAYGINDKLEIAIRNDGISANTFKNMETRIGIGATVNITDEIFCAVEYGHFMPSAGDAVGEIALQVGLESTLKLPGFQRKTLTRN
jgi:hypothetical protein